MGYLVPDFGTHFGTHFNVTVHDPVLMCLGERLGDLDADGRRLARREGSRRNHLGKGSALDVLHNDPVGVGLADDLVDVSDRRVRERRGGERLTAQTLAPFRAYPVM